MVEVMELIHELTPGDMSARSGVAVSALHFYGKKGLIASRRTSGNQRRYRRDTLRRVAMVRIGQRVGIPLAEIAAVLATLPDGRTPNRRDWAGSPTKVNPLPNVPSAWATAPLATSQASTAPTPAIGLTTASIRSEG